MRRFVCWIAFFVAMGIILVAAAVGCAYAARNIFLNLSYENPIYSLFVGCGGVLLVLLSISCVVTIGLLVALAKEIFKDVNC